jgi:hypothetical protein
MDIEQLERLCLGLPGKEQRELLLRLTERALGGLPEADRRGLVLRLIGQAGGEKTASLVQF